METQKLRLSKMRANFFKENHRVLIACSLFLLLTMQRFMAMFGVIFAIPVIIWFIYSIFVICIKPEKRKYQIVKMSIWTLVASIIFATHWYHSEVARHSAEDIVVSLKQYKIEHGAYPSSLNLIGQDSQQLKKELMLHYWLNDGKPTLIYASTLNPFDKFYYDFQTNSWIFQPD